MLTVLRQRNFGLAWTAGLISLTGDWLLSVGLPIYVYQLTGSTEATALAIASRVLPRLLLGSVAGVFVDRWDRRRTMIVSNLLLGLTMLPLLAVHTAEWLWVAYLVSLVEAVLTQFLGPAEQALLPRLVGSTQLVPANALNGLNNNLSRLVGPALGGLVVAAWGLAGAGLLNALTFFAAALLIALIRVDGRALPSERPRDTSGANKPVEVGVFAAAWAEWAAGMALVRRVRPVTVMVLFIAITGVGEGALITLFVPFITTVLGGGGVAYGAILSAQAVGGLIGNLAIGRVGTGLPPGRLMVAGALGIAAIDALTFNAYRAIPGLGPPLVLMVVVGLPAAAFGVGYNTLLQRVVEDAYRGRIFGALAATSALSVLIGTGLAGALSRSFSVASLVNIQVVAYLLGGLLVLAWLPRDLGRDVKITAEREGEGTDSSLRSE